MPNKSLYRYPGTTPYELFHQKIFFGREKDLEKLNNLLSIEKVVVLYARSGLGKSSLLNAGLLPKLNADDKKVLHFRLAPYLKGDTSTPKEMLQLLMGDRGYSVHPKIAHLKSKKALLWQYLKSFQLKRPETKDFYFIFDQFEQLFSYPEEFLNTFKNELAVLINGKMPQELRDTLMIALDKEPTLYSDEDLEFIYSQINVHILFAIRSDKVSYLYSLSDVIPQIMNQGYELAPLNRVQAEDAILNPAYFNGNQVFKSPVFDYTDEALDRMLRFLTRNNSKEIESFQLQILCRHAENLVINQQKTKIEANDFQNIEKIYQNYYDNIISGIGNDREQYQARVLLEEGLIFDTEGENRRLSLYSGQVFSIYGIAPDLMDKLVDSHLVRAVANPNGGFNYELSHDSLVEPILNSKKTRKEKEHQDRILKQQKSIANKNTQKILNKFKAALYIAVVVVASLVSWVYYKDAQVSRKYLDMYETTFTIKGEQSQVNTEELNKLSIKLRSLQKSNDSLKRLLSLERQTPDSNTEETARFEALSLLIENKTRLVQEGLGILKELKTNIDTDARRVRKDLDPSIVSYLNSNYFDILEKGIIRDYHNFSQNFLIPAMPELKLTDVSRHAKVREMDIYLLELKAFERDVLILYQTKVKEYIGLANRLRTQLYFTEYQKEQYHRDLQAGLTNDLINRSKRWQQREFPIKDAVSK